MGQSTRNPPKKKELERREWGWEIKSCNYFSLADRRHDSIATKFHSLVEEGAYSVIASCEEI